MFYSPLFGSYHFSSLSLLTSIEAKVSRLYGHSSSSGANRISEPDCLALFEAKIIEQDIADKNQIQAVWAKNNEEIDKAHQQAKQEPPPNPESIWENVFSSPLPDSYPTKGGS